MLAFRIQNLGTNTMNKFFRVIDRSIVLFGIITIIIMNSRIVEIQKTIDSIKPVDDCAWLYIDGKRGAVIYDRFDGTITIQCKGGKE